ncbi:alpha/beta hydrolase [Asanoa sp. NPDC049518]|uniref:alpha/beta fold hydrolase n=1 Tax=unclassified Asanoa TaxID=2685164 RepID=UPI00342EDB32
MTSKFHRARKRRWEQRQRECRELAAIANEINDPALGKLISFNFRLMDRFAAVAIDQARASYVACSAAAISALLVLLVGATTAMVIDDAAGQITAGAVTAVGAALGSATPLIMTHGWPGSIVEFSQVVGPLTDPRAHGGDPADAFHLVLPHIPGFGLSGPTHETGWEHRRVAAAFGSLMESLGYRRYGTQGGDWGSVISRELGRTRPDEVIGVHLNLLPGAHATTEPTAAELVALDPGERGRLLASWARTREWLRDRQGYADIQSTRPQTLAYGLTDSPVGQLAWIAEKFTEWADPRSGPIDRDHLLTNVMLYWLTGTAGSSARIYYERAHAAYWGGPPEPSGAPTALAVFPRDNFIPMRHIAERTNNIVRWTEYERGGHFAALEQPSALVSDIREFFRSLRSAA